jgi:hypothetical protein
MPWSNAIGATPDALSGILEYLDDENHPHHEEYLLTPLEVFGVKSSKDFLTYANETFIKNSKKKSGRPPVNAATWFVIRMPDGTWLTEDERSAYQNAACEEAGCGEAVVGIMNTHRNRLTGAEDINLLAAAFTSRGELVRDRNRDPIRSLRQRMDEVTVSLNLLRQIKGIHPIQTMQAVQAANRAKNDIIDVVELLAAVPKPPTTANELKLSILIIEGEVTRFNPAKDTISFILKGKKKAKKFRISKLLEDIWQAVRRLMSQSAKKDVEKKSHHRVEQ